MRFRLLGPVTAHTDQGPVELGPARQRTVLALLLLDPGAVLTADQLSDRLWGSTPPQRGRQTVHTYLSRLRAALAAGKGPVLVRRVGGYRLEIDPSVVDLHRFRDLAQQARQAGDDDRAAALWQEALDLWQGPPFAGVDCEWLQPIAAGLAAERRSAATERRSLLLRRGQYAQLLPELTVAVEEQPLDERLAAQLMLALYRCGRSADALAHYRLIHQRLVDELGSDPGPELRDLHQQILRQDSAGAGSPGRSAAEPAGHPPPRRPAQLPADVAGFTGRVADLRRLDELFDNSSKQSSRAVAIAAIAGTAGVGKTAFAVHWAHRVTERYPDGQLYVDLRGYGPEQPVAPADALAGFLTALGVTGQEIPLELAERAARFRSEVAGRRMLIMLDNAASVAQVRPLLPGTGSCAVLVTSRDSLAGLIAVHGAHRLDLDLLPADDATDLLHRLIGHRVVAEPHVAATLTQQCARLPLALRVAAELAVSRPDSPLADIVAELADRHASLDLLDPGDDPHTAVREVFSWSLQQVPAAAARTFRLLGLHPGADIDAYTAAALTNTGVDHTRQLLAQLARAHLLHHTAPDRYGMHDLLRAYATRLTTTEDTPDQQHAARERLFAYYQAAAIAAMDTLHPAEAHYRPDPPRCDGALPELAGAEAARAWLEAERANLIAVIVHAAAADRSGPAVALTRILHRHLSVGHPTDGLTINRHALQAAERTADVVGQAHALRQLGIGYSLLGQYLVAVEHQQRALAQFRRGEDLAGEAAALNSLGILAFRLGNHKQAMDDLAQATTLFRGVADRLGEALALSNLGNVAERLGRYAEAATHQRQAIVILRALGSRNYEAIALNNLANAELRSGAYEAAGDHLRQSLDVLRQLGNPTTKACALDSLGILHLHLGDSKEATRYFQQALAIYRRTGNRASQAWSLNGLGEAAQLAGETADAFDYYTEALAIANETDSRHKQARSHFNLGQAYRLQGDRQGARGHLERAYEVYTELEMPAAEDAYAYLRMLAV